jgi:hypothetical protein
MLSLFACLSPEQKARDLLKELRLGEEEDLEGIKRKYSA